MKKSCLFLLTGLLMPLFSGMAQNNDLVMSFEVGSSTVTVLSELQRQGNTDGLIGATEEMLKAYVPDGTYPGAVNAFLMQTEDQTILIDAGYGRELFNNLEAVKKTPEDIDIILMTHLHGDHIGGLLKDGKKSFPNAKIYIPQPEYDFWISDEAMQNQPENRRGGFANARQIFEVYKDKLHLFVPGEMEGNTHEVIPGVYSVAAYGHTPGHTGYLFGNGRRDRLFVWGDLTHAMAVQMPYPEVAIRADVDPVMATESRQRLLKYIADNNIRVAGMHIQFPGMGFIRKEKNVAYSFVLLCTCEGW